MGGTPIKDALDGAITAIAAAGCKTPRLDAEVLFAHVLGISRERLIAGSGSGSAAVAAAGGAPDRDLTISGPDVRAVQNAVRRRAIEREPVAYITGIRGFRRLELAVDRRALIPRPETELLVELAVARLPRGARVLDVGTGSGAVALALADERPDLIVSGSDVSEDALELARANGGRMGLRVDWLRADLLAGVPDEYGAIVSNPPYVAESERDGLAPEILRHEPAGALFAGPDGLDVISPIDDQVELSALGAADPVALHGLDPLRPVQIDQCVEQLIGVGRDAEEPLLQVPLDHEVPRALAAPVREHLLVREHRLAARAPVDRRVGAVGET